MNASFVQAVMAFLLAIGAHGLFFAIQPDTAGAASSGSSGTDLISLEPADASFAALVQEWETPPDVLATSASTEMPAQDMPPDMPQISRPATALPDLPRLPNLNPLAQADSMPMAEAAPPPEAKPAADAETEKPEPKTRPKERPDRAKPSPKAPKPSSSSGQAAQTAAGSGGANQAGDAGKAKAATLSKAKLNDLKSGWGATIRSKIERKKRYPAAAKGESGRVTVRLTIAPNGTLLAAAVAKSSGHAVLDSAALTAVRGAGRFPNAPKGLSDQSYSFSLSMSFKR